MAHQSGTAWQSPRTEDKCSLAVESAVAGRISLAGSSIYQKARPYNTGCLVVVKHHLNQKGTVADLDDDPDLDEESEGSMTDADMPHLLVAEEEYAEDGKHPAVN